jgi:hypothetical protein
MSTYPYYSFAFPKKVPVGYIVKSKIEAGFFQTRVLEWVVVGACWEEEK